MKKVLARYYSGGYKHYIHELSYETVDEWAKAFSVWKIDLPKEGNWRSGAVPCFMKHFMCKHLVGLAIRLKLTKPPVEAKNIPSGIKRQRWRPSKAKKAFYWLNNFV